MTHYGMRIRMGVAILVAAALAATGPAVAHASGVAESAVSYRDNGNPTLYNGVSPSCALDTFDPQGSVSQILDSTGTVSATQLYDAYGTLLHGTASYPYGFGAQYGYYTDQETDLLLLTHRYYDPSEGRFLTRDPIGYAGGMNLYAYCGNNPVNVVDPLGFCGRRAWWENLADGRYYGSTQGETARDWYAKESMEHPWNPSYWVGGTLASMWTPETWKKTAVTLAMAGCIKIGPSRMEPVHVGLDLPGQLNIIHYGEHVIHGRHIGLLFRGPGKALLHVNF